MAKLPTIYFVRTDVKENIAEAYDRWYNTKHVPDLLAAGFLSAVRFRSNKGEPKYMHVYEIPGVELLSTTAYKNVSKNDTQLPRFLAGSSNESASVYNQEVSINVPETPTKFPSPRTNSVGSIKSKYLVTIRMNVAQEAEEELIRWHRDEHMPLMLAAKGFVNGRLCRQKGKHPVLASLDPQWMSIWELDSLDALKDPKVKAANETPWCKKMHAVTRDVKMNVGERIFPL